MFTEDDAHRDTRQDILEAIASGMTCPVCGPLPGSIFETLEIAASRRSQVGTLESPPLTARAKIGPMIAILLDICGAVGSVAFRIRAGSGARRVPV